MSELTVSDAELALQLFIRNPLAFGGLALRGVGPVRDAMVSYAMSHISKCRKIAANIDIERLTGGLDLSATLASATRVMQPGLLDDVQGGTLIMPMAERMQPDVAAFVAQAIDRRQIAAVLLDDGYLEDEAPPASLMERMAYVCDMLPLRAFDPSDWPEAVPLGTVAPLPDDALHTLALTASALGITSARALLFAQSAALAHAALHGRQFADSDDLTAAVRLVLAPRATQLPRDLPSQNEQQPSQAETSSSDEGTNDDPPPPVTADQLDDIMLEAAAAAIPKHVLDQIDRQQRGHKGLAGRAGQKQPSATRGRPLGARPGKPGRGHRLALLDSLRAAAPWQTMRRNTAASDDDRTIHIRMSDLRIRRYEQRRESLTIFAVDASGSSALSRLAEAKGAVELMLAEAYVKRAQVALVAFRQTTAEVLLPPTRSLTRARRALCALPGGGGTPLAASLITIRQLAEAGAKRGQSPVIALLTDGKANVCLDGTANRTIAMDEARVAARNIALAGIDSIVIDISPRPRAEARDLADALNGRYLPMPQAQSAAMVAAIDSLSAQ